LERRKREEIGKKKKNQILERRQREEKRIF